MNAILAEAEGRSDDTTLVERARIGDREAFGRIVSRYQTLVCSLAFSACGSVTQSEDLAQETFLTAWRKLSDLREPSKLKAWLCGIARNLVNDSFRRQSRNPLAHAEPLDRAAAQTVEAEAPHQQLTDQEEERLVWQSLSTLPEDYRTPLVLFYREEQSVESVAAAMDLSEEVVRQRLSRGRAMLRQRVLTVVEGTLRRSKPGRVFTLAVLAALPVLPVSATAAAIGSSAVKGSVAAHSAAALGVTGAILGPIVGLLGAWFGIKSSLDQAGSPRERALIRRSVWIGLGYIGLFGLIVWLGVSPLGKQLGLREPARFAMFLIATGIGYCVGLGCLILWLQRSIQRLRQEEGRAVGGPGWGAQVPNAARCQSYEYRSRVSFLGWPLVHVKIGDPKGTRGIARGWIAIGDVAFGLLFALGGVAAGGIAIGGVAVGLAVLAGAAIGGVAVGGGALGWMSCGGGAIAWHAAYGGMAVAHDIALGGLAIAAHANDSVAKSALSGSGFFRVAQAVLAQSQWLILLTLVPVATAMWRGRRRKP